MEFHGSNIFFGLGGTPPILCNLFHTGSMLFHGNSTRNHILVLIPRNNSTKFLGMGVSRSVAFHGMRGIAAELIWNSQGIDIPEKIKAHHRESNAPLREHFLRRRSNPYTIVPYIRHNIMCFIYQHPEGRNNRAGGRAHVVTWRIVTAVCFLFPYHHYPPPPVVAAPINAPPPSPALPNAHPSPSRSLPLNAVRTGNGCHVTVAPCAHNPRRSS